MGEVQVPDYPRGVTFEQVWAILEENAEQHKKSVQEFDRIMKELTEQQKETDRKISKLGGRFGEMVEYMVLPNLIDKFRELGFVFTKAYPEAEIKDKKNNILAEIDVTLENGDKVMIVEVKSKPGIQDVKDHIERMKTVRRHADLHDDTRKYLGAVAGMVVKENVRDFILKNGFFVIVPSGNTFTIIPPGGNPKEW